MPIRELSRNAQLVKYFAQQSRGLPRTRLVKLIYMTDVLARQYLGRQVSSLRYYRYKFGPYDRAIESAVAELVESGYAEERREIWSTEGAYRRLFDLHQPTSFTFDLCESAILDYVSTNYVDMPWKELLQDVVYETAPMKAGVRKKQYLPMDMINDSGTRIVGFKLDEILRLEQESRPDDFVSLSDFVDELRAKAPS